MIERVLLALGRLWYAVRRSAHQPMTLPAAGESELCVTCHTVWPCLTRTRIELGELRWIHHHRTHRVARRPTQPPRHRGTPRPAPVVEAFRDSQKISTFAIGVLFVAATTLTTVATTQLGTTTVHRREPISRPALTPEPRPILDPYSGRQAVLDSLTNIAGR